LPFIRRAKDLGFTLAEIAGRLETDGTGVRSSGAVLAAAGSRLAAVEQEITDLEATRVRLRSLLVLCADDDAGCLDLAHPCLA